MCVFNVASNFASLSLPSCDITMISTPPSTSDRVMWALLDEITGSSSRGQCSRSAVAPLQSSILLYSLVGIGKVSDDEAAVHQRTELLGRGLDWSREEGEASCSFYGFD